jgi:hypothetical protein
MALPDRDEVEIPSFLSMKTRNTDAVYRHAEIASEHRAHMAADMLGVPVSEVSDMKITNMRDNMREGDIAAMPPQKTAVTRAMENSPQFGFNPNQGVEYSHGVQSGPYANSGVNFLQKLREHHVRTADPRQAGKVSSDLPALETMQPGYRRRAK